MNLSVLRSLGILLIAATPGCAVGWTSWRSGGSVVPEYWDQAAIEDFEQARTIKPSTLRSKALKDAVQRWAELDFAAAQRAVETLPTEDRIYLQDVLKLVQQQQQESKEG